MIYVVIPNVDVVKILHFLSVSFVAFGLIFLLIVNLIILESTIIYSVKRQNRFILYYGIILFAGLLILVLLPVNPPLVFFDETLGWDRYPEWHPFFFAYQVSVITCLGLIPLFYTSFKIYHRFETKELKRKWRYYLYGSLGLVIFNYYPISLSNLLNFVLRDHPDFLTISRSIVSILGITVILWVSLMYYGIGSKLKK
ncbi:MAG: hypothetical protein ACFE8N_07285 [Promethearchaeota archaeon]